MDEKLIIDIEDVELSADEIDELASTIIETEAEYGQD